MNRQIGNPDESIRNEEPLADREYRMEKFPGKGGWTFVRIPEIPLDKKSPFGWVKVKGRIDHFAITGYHLMPDGKGNLFLPIKAEIRKKLGKAEGDSVRIVLFKDNDPIQLPEELRVCLAEDPHTLEVFESYTDGRKKELVDWIYSARKEETRINRIADLMNRLSTESKKPGRKN